MKVNYVLKLKALLHEPVHKYWINENKHKVTIKHKNTCTNHECHEMVAEDIFRFFFDECIEDSSIEKACKWASSISDIPLKEEVSISLKESDFIDPFSGKREKIGNPQTHDEVIKVFENISKVFQNEPNKYKLVFLFLWRFLPEIFPWIENHPADIKVPNYSIYEHLVQTSAIVSSIQKPAFLLFTIGPVQGFISTARKTSDLWAGSYMLSYLIYKAIEVVMEKFGPDHIIFPALLGQPLVDRWLYNKMKNINNLQTIHPKVQEWFDEWKRQENHQNSILDENLTIANFPNRFLAILPYEEAKKVAKECKEAILKELESLSKSVSDTVSDKTNPDLESIIFCHLRNYFKIYYVILPWGDKLQTVLDEYKELVGENEIYNLTHQLSKYIPNNLGIAYSLLVELAERFLASRKLIRDTHQIDPQKKDEKCHLCGNFDALKEVPWNKLYPKWVREKERLCGVCLTKRMFPEVIRDRDILNLSDEIKFPSTSEMATVKYKIKLDKDDTKEFRAKFECFNNILGNKIPSTISVPRLKEHDLNEIDGQWLFKESYREKYLEKEYKIKDLHKAKNEKESLFEEIDNLYRRFGKPPTYYAILYMDGDNMGKWLKGGFMPTMDETLHPEFISRLLKEYGEDLEKLIHCSKHPMSASFHFAFSRKLSKFALEVVRKIVEKDFYGKLIYAGGDDVLAFLPSDEVLSCAYQLQKEFKNILGEKASMSAGIALVHHKYPLSLALKKAKEAENRAKSKYGKDAFCIYYVSHGGYIRITGGKWKLYEFFRKIRCLRDRIPSRFGYEVLETVQKLGLDDEMIKLEVKRILRRKSVNLKIENLILMGLDKFEGRYDEFANAFVILKEF